MLRSKQARGNMAWPIYQWPRYSRLITIILIYFFPPSEVTAMILTNTLLEANYLYLFLPEGTNKTSKLFFVALIITQRRAYKVNGEHRLTLLLSLSGLTPLSQPSVHNQVCGRGGVTASPQLQPLLSTSLPGCMWWMHARKPSMHEVLTYSQVSCSVQHLNLPNPPCFFAWCQSFETDLKKVGFQ